MVNFAIYDHCKYYNNFTLNISPTCDCLVNKQVFEQTFFGFIGVRYYLVLIYMNEA